MIINSLDKLLIQSNVVVGNYRIIASVTDSDSEDTFKYQVVGDANTSLEIGNSETVISNRDITHLWVVGTVNDTFNVYYRQWQLNPIDNEVYYNDILLKQLTLKESSLLFDFTDNSLVDFSLSSYYTQQQVDSLLTGKADSVHNHQISDIIGLATELNNKSSVGHMHAISDVTGLQTALDDKYPAALGANNYNLILSNNSQINDNDDDIAALQSGKANIVHNHIISDTIGLQSALDALSGSSGALQWANAWEEQPSGTSGGTFTAGAWRTRTLNTIATSTSDITLSGNTVTIANVSATIGTWLIIGGCPAARVRRHQCRLNNSGSYLYGSSAYATPSEFNTTESTIYLKVSVTTGYSFTLEHQCETTYATHGFGVGTDFGPNIFSRILLLKVD